MAEKFVRVRVPRVDDLDLNLFDFDLDLTMMVFFLNAEDQVYARYGGRDAQGPDERQSLAGLRHTMQSVLRMHEQARPEFAPKAQDSPKYLRDVSGGFRGGRGCLHCHQVREVLDADLRRAGQSIRDLAYRFPLPENVGLEMEVDRGNVVRQVRENSAAQAAGLRAGDVVTRLSNVPVHSQADVQYALDRAATAKPLDVAYERSGERKQATLALSDGWRRTDISWRTSQQRNLPASKLHGFNLTAAEKQALGLSAKQLAFRHQERVSSQAQTAGIRPGDIILGIDDQTLEMSAIDLSYYIRRNYLVGDRVTVNLIRDGKRLNLPMTLSR